ncbi:MAG TPA: LysM peptidoglycan-binding domain-containing protein, partial [Clostridia bacterium]|nr:LysM peptidoglycan-binding domain-containing protein [Clostridia bacterium]
NDINDLAETALDVTGTLKLQGESTRAPYFSGFVMRDGEMAAVTVGNGRAFIYRSGALYPLTGGSTNLEATDLDGDLVEGMDDFIAGEAGSIRYSNIAQIEQGDILILCNDDLFDVIGQKEILRLLADAEDQMDAAGLLLTAAASQIPGTPIQIAAARVEEVKAAEAASRFSLGRFATQAMAPVVEPGPSLPDVELGRTQRYQRQNMVDLTKPLAPVKQPFDTTPQPAWGHTETHDEQRAETFGFASAPSPSDGGPVEPHYDPFAEQFGQLKTPARPTYQGGDDYYDDERSDVGQTDLPEFAYSSAAQRRSRSQHDDYDHQEPWETGDDLESAQGRYDPYGDYEDDDDGYGRQPKAGSDRTRRIVFYAILIAIILICIVALILLLKGGGGKTTPTESTSVTAVVPTESAPPVTSPPTETTEALTTAPESQDKIHLVVQDDTWWGICLKYYDRASESLCEKLAEYNGMSITNLFVGNEIAIPPLSELLGD